MPFGLKNATATFNRLIKNILLKHHGYATSFVDDILIFSENIEDHITHAEKVINTLSKANLTIKFEKCVWGHEEVEFLGFNIGKGKLSPIRERLNFIKDCIKPSTMRELRSFLGMIGFYGRFLPNKFAISFERIAETKVIHHQVG